MWINTSSTTRAWVTWRPREGSLHYLDLYRGLWEFVRMPPRREVEARAREYLTTLLMWPHGQLQHDRIRWVSAWLDALPGEDERRLAMGEEHYRMLSLVCYESPTGMRDGCGKLRAG